MEEALKKLAESVPTLYRKPYMRALVGKGGRAMALKLKCLECCAWQRKEDGIDRIGDCSVRLCPLWAFRPFQTENGVHGE